MRNTFVFLGRLTDVPQIEEKVTRFTIACEEGKKNENDEKIVNYFQITAFGKRKEIVDKHLKKGMMVQCSGEVRNNNYQKEDHMVYSNSFVLTNVEFG